MMPISGAAQRDTDDRQYERIATTLAGKLFVPAEDFTMDCVIVNLSAGGAGVRCVEPPPLNTFVVLYIDGFGRFDGVATRFVDGELGLRFVCKEAKRNRLIADLVSFAESGTKTFTRLRRHHRVVSDSEGKLFWGGGQDARYEILDVSLQGASVRTEARPPLGELVTMGRTRGRVVRHTSEGIAVQFVEHVKIAEVQGHGG